MIDNDLTETLQGRAAATSAPDLARLFDGIERRGVRRQRRRIAGAAVATVAVISAVTGIAVGLHGSSSGSPTIPPAKHTNSPSPTSPHTTIEVTSSVTLDPPPRLSESSGTPIVAEAPDGTVVYASGPGIWQARSGGRSLSIAGGDAPVIALAASDNQVVALTKDQIVVTTVLHTPGADSSAAGGGAGYETFPTPGASTSAPINDGGVAIEGSTAYVWDRHDDHGNPAATLSRIDLSTDTSTVVDRWLTPGAVYADQSGIYYENEANGTRLAHVGPSGPHQLAQHRSDLAIIGLYDGALVGEKADQNGPAVWRLINLQQLRPFASLRPRGVFGARLVDTSAGTLTLAGTYPCYGPAGSCRPTSVHAINRRTDELVDTGTLSLPRTELLIGGGTPTAVTGGGNGAQLVRLSVSRG